MIGEAKQQYLGFSASLPSTDSAFVLCSKQRIGFKEKESSGRDEATVRSFTVSSFALRCRVCEGEGLYTALNVIDCSGTPRMRSSKLRKLLPIYPI